MGNIRQAIQPKSDQLNADDLIGGLKKRIRITRAKVNLEAKEQMVTIHYENENGKPWKPCKTMSKVMVELWGDEEDTYVGSELLLYRDDSVKWGGEEVGGIRIEAATGITSPKVISVTVSNKAKKRVIVQPLKPESPAPKPEMSEEEKKEYLDKFMASLISQINFIESLDSIEAFLNGTKTKMDSLLQKSPDRHAVVMSALTDKQNELRGRE